MPKIRHQLSGEIADQIVTSAAAGVGAQLLSIDPVAALAQMQEQIHRRLLEITPTDLEELKAAWRATAESRLAALSATPASAAACPAQFLILVTCRDEKHQVELLNRLSGEGLECRALLS